MMVEFRKEPTRLLEEHQITPEKYITWTISRFRKRVYQSGAVVSAIFFVFLLVIAFKTQAEPGSTPGIFWYIVAVDILMTSLFLGVAVSWLNGTSSSQGTGENNLPQGYQSIGLLNYTSEKFMSKISEREWLRIAAFDLDTFRRKEAERNKKPDYSVEYVEKLERHKKTFLRLGILSLITIVLLTAACVLLPPLSLSEVSPTRVPLLIAFTALYCIMITGFHGRVFLYAMIGFITRRIKVEGEYAEALTYRGKGAILWSVILMLLIAVNYVGFMIVPAAFFSAH